MRVKYRLKNQFLYHEDMVDVMNVAGKLRYSDSSGKQNKVADAEVIGSVSEDPCMVVIQQEGGTSTFRSIKVTAKQGNHIYLSGSNFMERVEGNIVRIRNQMY